MEVIITGIVPILAVIVARVVLGHREFRDQEYLYIFERNAINEETTEDQIYTVTERPGKTKRKHQATPKQVRTREAVHYKKFLRRKTMTRKLQRNCRRPRL